MEHPEERYYKVNRFFLKIAGLWPYQNTREALIVRGFITVIIISSLFVQLMGALRTEITKDYFIEAIPVVMPTAGTLLHLYARLIYIDKLKELFDCIWNDWALQKTENETKIMQKHAGTSRKLTFYCALQIFGSVMMYVAFLHAPDILDVISPMNESRPRKQYYKIHYFINEENNIVLIRLHIAIVSFVIAIVFTTCVTLFITFAQHINGMCELLGYRAQRLFYVVESTAERDLSDRKKLINRNTAIFIQTHQNIIQFVEIIEHIHTVPFLMDLLGIIFVLSFTLTEIVTISDNVEKAIRSSSFINMQLIYLFVFNYFGQQIMDNTSKISDKVYDSTWYNTIVAQQKPLLLIMKRRFKPLVLTACKFYVMSLPNLGKVLQTTISYCMFMRRI